MSSVTAVSDFSNLQEWQLLQRYVSMWADDVTNQLNGGIDFSSNVRCRIIDVVFPTANVEQLIIHSLGKAPIGYILVKSNLAVVIYDGTTTNTSSALYLKANAASTCRIMIF